MKYFILIYLVSFRIWSGEVIGLAYSGQNLIYTEKHSFEVNSDGTYKKLKTQYYDKNQKLFAEIESDFKENLFVPNIVFTDYRFDLKENINLVDKDILINRLVKNDNRSTRFKIDNNFILGQGFHNFIVANWDKFAMNELEIKFIVSSSGKFFNFTAKMQDNGKNKIVSLNAANFLLRAIVGPIKVTYDSTTKKLIKFEGLSNLDDERGNVQNVTIIYN